MKFIIPLLLFALLSVFLAVGLWLDPRKIPSPLLNKLVPHFDLPLLLKPNNMTAKDMLGTVWLLNVWASWCGSCRAEHPLLNQLAADKIAPIIGLNYKDNPTNAKRWLAELGNPYQASLVDEEGRTGIDYGVYGVPETFVIDKRGILRHKHTGALTLADIKQTIIPLIAKLNATP